MNITEYKLELHYADGSQRILSFYGNESIIIESNTYTLENGKIGVITHIPRHILTKFLEILE